MLNPRQFVESLARGFKILCIVCESQSSPSLSELAKKSGLSISTIQRLSHTLQQLELLVRDPNTKRFRMGPKMITLALTVINKLELKKIAQPFMQDASDRIGEVVGLGELSGDQIIMTEIIKTNQILNINMNTGAIIPPHATASGKAILAYVSESKMEAMMNKSLLTEYTGRTMTSKTSIKKQLNEVRQKGYALNIDENAYGFSAIAAPVRNDSGDVIAAVTIMVPSTRVSKEKLVTFLRKEVFKTADNISYAMGYRENS